ncbi:hypothetical protein ABIA06_003129 [Bradyrhizobium yuanmingense]|uniref:hypothetical protein n=1 Tax=Bradyrhizobium yuanmingense TaxID=108015 RepID=UPI003512E1F0
MTYSRPAARHPSGAQIEPGDRKQLYERYSCDRSYSELERTWAAGHGGKRGYVVYGELIARGVHRYDARPSEWRAISPHSA